MRVEDISGEHRHNFTILKKEIKTYQNSKARLYWRCKCDCGKEFSIRNDHLQRDIRKSCGCSHQIGFASGKEHGLWAGVGEISGRYFGTIRANANRLSLEFTITKDYVWELFVKQDKKCALTGIPLEFNISKRTDKTEQTASLDRIDSSKGYIPGNVWWVHKDVNRMKNAYDLEYFYDICERVVANRNTGNLLRVA